MTHLAEPLTQHRAGETGHHPFRSDRLYFSDDVWYFMIRGGNSKGPFANAPEAKHALKHYIQTLNNLYEAFHKPTEEDHH